jgi:uncharacterized tellurite resistance protein B-like protein
VTPKDKAILKSLVAFAWADGKVDDSESNVIDGVLKDFDATDAEREEVLAYAKEERTLDDIPLDDLDDEDRELLLANAAVLTRADGEVAEGEQSMLDRLSALLGFSSEAGAEIVEKARDGALQLRSASLNPVGTVPPPAPSKRK